MRHQDLTINHILESWTFANATARDAAGGYVSGDLGRIGYQTDTAQYWRLTATTPTWAKVEGTTATFQGGTQVSPTGYAGASTVMVGLAYAITPIRSGKVVLMIAGSLTNDTNVGGSAVELRYGTGTAPVNGAAVTGTLVGPASVAVSPTANYPLPFSVMGVVTGLIPGTPIWFDLDLSRGGGAVGTAKCQYVCGSAYELP